jgi:HPt (histidine-containing phosphotransfer) domain-containing protein
MKKNDPFADLTATYIAELPERLTRIDRALDVVRTALAKSTVPNWKELTVLVHKLAGSAGIYGLPELSEIARSLEDELDAKTFDRLQPSATLARLAKWRDELQAAIQKRKAAA